MIVSELDRLVSKATGLHYGGDPRGAESLLRDVLFMDPAHLLALTKAGELAVERREPAVAFSYLHAALRIEPRCAPALSHLSHALWLSGRIAEALDPARAALDIQPPNPLYRINLGQILAWIGRSEEAIEIVDGISDERWHAADLRARACSIVGEALTARGDFVEAHEAFEKGMAIAPNFEPLHMGFGMSLLRLGRFREGWRSYGRRDRIPFFHSERTADLPGRRWRGEALEGGSILLVDDQGYGDAIQFFRHIPQVALAGAGRIALSTFPGLRALFAASTRLAEVSIGAPPGFAPDWHCVTADLPGALDTRMETIPADVPYLVPPEVVRPTGPRPRIGLAWSGDPRHLNDHMRSIPADVFLRLADLPGVDCGVVQNAIRPGDLPAVVARPSLARVGETMSGFDATAAAVAGMDLVISVDTSIAHLAGALGRPVWLLVPVASEWRWLADRDDSPWYPTMRLFRAGRDGWAPVIARVADELSRFAARFRR